VVQAARSAALCQGNNGRGHGGCDSSIRKPWLSRQVLSTKGPYEGVQPVPHPHYLQVLD